jgi:hypothetical protein
MAATMTAQQVRTEMCRILSDALRDAVDRLAVVTARMADITGTGEPALFAAARRDLQSLRNQCEEARLELKRYTAEHQPSTQH